MILLLVLMIVNAVLDMVEADASRRKATHTLSYSHTLTRVTAAQKERERMGLVKTRVAKGQNISDTFLVNFWKLGS